MGGRVGGWMGEMHRRACTAQPAEYIYIYKILKK